MSVFLQVLHLFLFFFPLSVDLTIGPADPSAHLSLHSHTPIRSPIVHRSLSASSELSQRRRVAALVAVLGFVAFLFYPREFFCTAGSLISRKGQQPRAWLTFEEVRKIVLGAFV